MGKLGSLRDERRKAESEVGVLKARIRLLREVSDANEKRAAREVAKTKAREVAQGDAEWLRDTLESEYMRREMCSVEKRMLAVEQRDVTAQQLQQSKQLVAEHRLAAARRVREENTYKLGAALDQKNSDLERRRQMAEHGRRHRQWYKEVSKNAAEEFKNRVHELRGMAMAEEETRRFLVMEDSAKFVDALAFEELRLKEVRGHAASCWVGGWRGCAGGGTAAILFDSSRV